ncbi:MAG: hypothetical protein AAGF15_11725 [Pseudomonadota bacterium]
MKTFDLNRIGQRPLRVQGEILLDISSTDTSMVCRLIVIETGNGYVGHVSVDPLNGQGQLSFVHAEDDPLMLREWFDTFDPTHFISTADIMAKLESTPDEEAVQLSKAARVITARLNSVRGLYTEVLKQAFGIHSQHQLAA